MYALPHGGSCDQDRHPKTLAIGEYRDDAGDVLRIWEREIERIHRLYGVSLVKALEY